MARKRASPPPLDAAALERLGLRYLGRYATTRAKLRDYFRRKLAERGWAGEGSPPVDALVARMTDLGYVDDAAFAASRTRALSRRGFGDRRIAGALRAAGVDDADAEPPRREAAEGEWDAALAFARRRRLGPFAATRPDRPGREKAIAALLRAGHDFATARRIADAEPGAVPDRDDG